MSYLLFLDESGHDHRNTPYEVRGGFAIHTTRLWPFIQAVKTLELSIFGAHLHEFGSEIKGSKLLQKDRFKWSRQGLEQTPGDRRKNALNFLNSTKQKRKPRQEQFTAYGQASLVMVEGILQLLRSHDAKVFAAMIPRVSKPDDVPLEFLRKDIVFLLERFFYFLEAKQETGLLVMDGTEKKADRRFVRRVERYFTNTQVGKQRTKWIVPVPFFVESDMAYGVQVADMCIYCLNWTFRLPGMSEPAREDLDPFARLLERVIWHGGGYRDQIVFKTHGVVYVSDPYEAR